MSIETLKKEALQLSLEDRAFLARELLLSLETMTDQEIEGMWIKEASRREREMDTDMARCIPADEALDKAYQRRK